MAVFFQALFIIALIGYIYVLYKKPSIDNESISELQQMKGIQELAKLFILTDDTITYVANNHPEFYAKNQLKKRLKSFENDQTNFIYEAIVQSEANNKVMSACCDASGTFNPDYAGNLGIIYNKLQYLIQLTQNDAMKHKNKVLDHYIYVKKNFDELQLLYSILNRPLYSYYLVTHHVDQLNSVQHTLKRLISVYEDDYQPHFAELETVNYATVLNVKEATESNDRQL